MRSILALALLTLLVASGCGGGGGSSISSSSSSSSGSSSGGSTPTAPTQHIASAGPPNVEPLAVTAGPAGVSSVNVPYLSIKICVPGTTNCQTIDNVEVDTGSIGLRLVSSAVTLTLPAEKDGSASQNPLSECLEFADNTAIYGSVVVADVELPVSGETASNVNVQLIGAAGYGSNVPNNCTGTLNDTVNSFGANGILGVGFFPSDCNSGPCTFDQFSAIYYSCPTPASCTGFAASETQQLPNPVTLFATDNNGVIMELPAVNGSGATDPSGGVIVFGIGTESNNALGSATQLTANTNTGNISASLGVTSYSAYLDSGSNALFVPLSLTVCSDNSFYCPASSVSEDSELFGANNASLGADFIIGNADDLFSSGGTAFNDLGAPGFTGSSGTIFYGLPFFFGRNIYLGFYTASSNPYFAY